MWRRAALVAWAFGGLVACSEEAPKKEQGGGASGAAATVAGMSGTGGSATSGTGGASGGSSSSGTAGGGSGGVVNPNECALQGEFSASADMQIQDNVCNTLGSFKTNYDLVIDGQGITLVKPIEMLPMVGIIDAQCEAHIVQESPDYREFELTFEPATLSAMGTHIDALANGCRTTYDASLTLTRK